MGFQFHETVYGKRYYEYQLPQLIKELHTIGEALGSRNEKGIVPSSTLTEEQRIRLQAVMEDEEKSEAVANCLLEQIRTDDEPPRKVGHYFAKTVLDQNIDDLMIAICGWSVNTLLDMAEKKLLDEKKGDNPDAE